MKTRILCSSLVLISSMAFAAPTEYSSSSERRHTNQNTLVPHHGMQYGQLKQNRSFSQCQHTRKNNRHNALFNTTVKTSNPNATIKDIMTVIPNLPSQQEYEVKLMITPVRSFTNNVVNANTAPQVQPEAVTTNQTQ